MWVILANVNYDTIGIVREVTYFDPSFGDASLNAKYNVATSVITSMDLRHTLPM